MRLRGHSLFRDLPESKYVFKTLIETSNVYAVYIGFDFHNQCKLRDQDIIQVSPCKTVL